MGTSQDKTLTPVAVQILLALADGSLHGYGIKLDIERRTDGAMSLGSGTLYEAIQRLEKGDLISETEAPEGETDARSRRYYRLTEEGRRALKDELAGLAAIVRYAESKHLITQPR